MGERVVTCQLQFVVVLSAGFGLSTQLELTAGTTTCCVVAMQFPHTLWLLRLDGKPKIGFHRFLLHRWVPPHGGNSEAERMLRIAVACRMLAWAEALTQRRLTAVAGPGGHERLIGRVGRARERKCSGRRASLERSQGRPAGSLQCASARLCAGGGWGW